jgi:hypothetical protein
MVATPRICGVKQFARELAMLVEQTSGLFCERIQYALLARQEILRSADTLDCIAFVKFGLDYCGMRKLISRLGSGLRLRLLLPVLPRCALLVG